MTFVVDGSEWRFDDFDSDQIIAKFDSFLALLQVARDRNETVLIGDDFQYRPMLGELDLWSLKSPASSVQLPEEIWQELTAWLNSAGRYADLPDWPAGLEHTDIAVNNEAPVDNIDLAWVHHSVRAGAEIGLLGLERDGEFTTTSSLGQAAVWWVAAEAAHKDFWRAVLHRRAATVVNLGELAPHAFPNLLFARGAVDGVRHLAGGYVAISQTVQKYLAVLDDFGYWAFTFPPPALSFGEPAGPNADARPSDQTIIRRFIGLGLDVTPENPEVREDPICRRAREFEVEGSVLYCEWHGKLEPHRNRVYVHPPVDASGGKVLIAVFHEHLPLP